MMHKARQLLIRASQKLELPADIIAGVPRIEIIGAEEFCLEPHRGLVEYSSDRISLMTSIGTISVVGGELTVKRMNDARITITGNIEQIKMSESSSE